LAHKEEIDEAIAHVLEQGQYILGPQVEAFEEEFARYIGVDYCVGVASGTDALVLALHALGLERGTKVLTSALSASATAAAITYAGFRPHFLDVDQERSPFMGDWSPQVHMHVNDELPLVIMPVHLYGQPDGVYNMSYWSTEHDNIYMIEDCAQAHGAQLHNDKKVGTYGQFGCFSFYPTKNLGCLGDGGAVVTDDEDLYWRVRKARQYGWFLKG
jgi:dTDP-4-amino-4,6-dideoxygalactose transaminase